MALQVAYTNFNGRLLYENRSGVESFYVPNQIGSAAALTDGTGSTTDTFTYWPYGEIRSRTGGSQTPFAFIGLHGYYTDTVDRIYIRARHYSPVRGAWLSTDVLWPNEKAYSYVDSSPTNEIDFTGNGQGCKKNTDDYNKRCRKTGNMFDCCAGAVSGALCTLINLGEEIELSCGCRMVGDLARAVQCQNDCMADLWRKKDTTLWKKAKQICSKFGEKSVECCKASVSAEQAGYDSCAPGCFPELLCLSKSARVNFALDTLKCCDPNNGLGTGGIRERRFL